MRWLFEAPGSLARCSTSRAAAGGRHTAAGRREAAGGRPGVVESADVEAVGAAGGPDLPVGRPGDTLPAVITGPRTDAVAVEARIQRARVEVADEEVPLVASV